MAPARSPANTGPQPEVVPAWATAMLQQMQTAMGDQATALRAEADTRQQQMDAAILAMQSSARPPTPPPPTTARAAPPAPAKSAARLASQFEAAENPAPAALDAALLAALGPGEHSQLAAAVAAGDLPAATAILQSGDRCVDFSARAGGGSEWWWRWWRRFWWRPRRPRW